MPTSARPVGAARPLDDLVRDPGERPVDPGLVEDLGLLAQRHRRPEADRPGRARGARGPAAPASPPETGDKMPSRLSREGVTIRASRVVIASPCGPRRAHLKELPFARTLRRGLLRCQARRRPRATRWATAGRRGTGTGPESAARTTRPAGRSRRGTRPCPRARSRAGGGSGGWTTITRRAPSRCTNTGERRDAGHPAEREPARPHDQRPAGEVDPERLAAERGRRRRGTPAPRPAGDRGSGRARAAGRPRRPVREVDDLARCRSGSASAGPRST